MSLVLDIERLELIRVLCRRAVRMHFREALRANFKSPFVSGEAWEEAREAYALMFPMPEAECNYVGRCNSSRCPKHGPKGRA